jgi:hypothetical protein
MQLHSLQYKRISKMKKMTPEKFAQMVYDSWMLTAKDFCQRYVTGSDLMEEVIMEQAVMHGAKSAFPEED